MQRLGWTIAQPMAGPADAMHYVKNIPNLQGILEGYGVHNGIAPESADYTLNGVPVFHSLTDGTAYTGRQKPIGVENPRKAKILADEIKSIKITERPGFIHAWTMCWDYGPTNLKMAADLLPSEYVIVRPDELAALYKKYKGNSTNLVSVNPKVTPFGTVTETPNGNDGLIIDTGKIKVEIGWGKDVQEPVKRIMGVDGKWRCSGRAIQFNKNKLTIKAFKCEKTKDTPSEKDYRLTYSYNRDDSIVLNICAIAGRPYLLFDEETTEPDLPTWSFIASTDFQPDTLYTNKGSKVIDHKTTKSMGSVPWYRWMLVGKDDGPERDLIGLFAISWVDWTNADVLMWQTSELDTYFEFYDARAGKKRFAVAALDRDDADAPMRIWKELNGK
jgi:hypothetical protein